MDKQSVLSRRAFLKLAGVAASGAILAACKSPATPQPAAQKKTLTLAIQSFAHDAIRPVLDAWTAQTGHQVNLVGGPPTGMEVIAQYGAAFQAGTSPVDVFSMDDAGPVMYRSGWIEPLDSVIPQETWDDFPKIFQPQIEVFHSYQGKRYRVPHEFAIGYFWYRKDWFSEKNQQPPKTWDEFIATAKEYTQGEVSGTIEGLKPGFIYSYLAYYTAQTGGQLFNFDEQTATAFQFIYDLVYTHKVVPESALNMDYTNQNDAYMQDRVAMMRQWPYFWGVSRDNKSWYADGKAEIALPPAGPGGAKSWWGGWGFCVPRSAPNKEEALDLIRWITSNANAPLLAKAQSWFIMPRKSILTALGNEGLLPFMKTYIENNVPSSRPFHEQQDKAETVVNDIGALFLTRQISLAEAMKQGAERIKALK